MSGFETGAAGSVSAKATSAPPPPTIMVFFIVSPFHGKSHSLKCALVTFIEICYRGCVIGRFSKITIKPGFCTKPEFCTNGSKRYLTGGQYYKIGLYGYFGPNVQSHSHRNIFDERDQLSILMKVTILLSMNVTSVLMNRNFDEWVYDHFRQAIIPIILIIAQSLELIKI